MKHLLVLLALLLCAIPPQSAQPGPQGKADTPDLPPGLDSDKVRRRLGPPRHIARQLLARRCRAQWFYGNPHSLRLVFEWTRGQKPTLRSVHKLNEP